MDKALLFNKRVGPNNHAGWNFSKTLMNMQLGTVYKTPSKITFRNKKWELKVQKSQFRINQTIQPLMSNCISTNTENLMSYVRNEKTFCS